MAKRTVSEVVKKRSGNSDLRSAKIKSVFAITLDHLGQMAGCVKHSHTVRKP
jgi:hypothetical protein